ncbi:MupA/Atu3671 family FMN-dependent luciferase-like monooxygenase [Saccharomonospora sp. NB11]|uniref:MupA/Atu3671 family FMN-dependent luciferase-like monooxygenase n=1 Tax=Saccharomonospora sp. NB11 TaxID=1642298 RepID=UPI0018D02C86|nr:MupA/Atu3671 family FMN-dependent luciferase-like monooxygenase [Saccharomonospora sp. NB11]
MQVEDVVAGIAEQLLELDPGTINRSVPLLDLGADSLVLVELSREIQQQFNVDISVQQLLEDIVTVRAIARWTTENQQHHTTPPAPPETNSTPPTHNPTVEDTVADIAEQLLELDPGTINRSVPLLDLGADSLVLVELSREIQQQFNVDISVQQLLEDIVTVRAIARWTTENQQHHTTPPAPPETNSTPPSTKVRTAHAPALDETTASATPPPARPAPRRTRTTTYAAATSGSRTLSERSQARLCNNRKIAQREHDERAASYPIWVTRSSGAHVWDVDDRKLIDLTMGYGAHLFGHNPDFVCEAVQEQLDRGLHIGAEIEQTADVARLLCELTGMDRVNFCVTGTEAVFTAMRLARAYTGRSLVVLLQTAYHGHSDSTLFNPRPGKRREHLAAPSFPGVSTAAADDVRILPVSEQHLSDFMAARGEEVAAVVMEPRLNQSPDLDLGSLVRLARDLTEQAGALLVFDEVLTGFRFHTGGFQQIYGVRADLATYGKTLAAGLPLAAVAGRAEIMDLIDGGPWTEELRADPDRVSFTGGTYAKHPLSIAAARAVLGRLARDGDTVLTELNTTGDDLRAAIARILTDSGVDVRVIGVGSFFRFVPAGSTSFAYGGKAFHEFRRAMIAEGVLVPETGNCFLSPAHTPDVRRAVLDAVTNATKRLSDEDKTTDQPVDHRSPTVSLALFGFAANGENDIYSRLLDLVEHAEAEGLANVWLPERHFDDFAGFSPNPAVLGAMVAARTSRLGIRAGSSVLPLHSAISVAEDWAMVDVASGGRVGLGVASGWMRRDFVLSDAPHSERRALFRKRVAELERLWRGEALEVEGHSGERAEVRLHPRPLSDLRLWQACVGSPNSFYEAGRDGRGVLTNLIQQDIEQLSANLQRYREGRRDGGFPQDGGDVTVLLHAAVSTDSASEERNMDALERYMFATFRATHDNPETVSADSWKPRMRAAAERLRNGLSLVGPETEWPTLATTLARLGVTEIACLVDFLPHDQAWSETVRALGRLHTRLADSPSPSSVEQAGISSPSPITAPDTDPTATKPGAEHGNNVAPVRADESARRELSSPVTLSRAAREIWAACQISAETREAYVIARTFSLSPEVDLDRLRQAYLDTLEAQPAYRLRVTPDGSKGWAEPFGEEHRSSWHLLDGIAESAVAFESEVKKGSLDLPLDPAHRCGVRMTCQRTADGLLVNLRASHIVLDGMRFSELLESVARRYEGKPVDVQQIPASAQLDRKTRDRDRAYWDSWVASLPDEVFDTGFDVRTLDRRGYRLSAPLPAGLRENLANYARAERSTSFVEALRATAEIVDDTLGRHHLYAFPVQPSLAEYGSCAVLVPFWRGSTTDGASHTSVKGSIMAGVEHSSLTFRQVFNNVTRRVQTPTVTVSWDNLESFELSGHRVEEVSMPTDVVRFPLTVTFTQRSGGAVELSLDAAHGFLARDEGERLFARLTGELARRFAPSDADTAPGGDESRNRVAPDMLARLVRGLALPVDDRGAPQVSLDGRSCPLDLIASKARASARILAEEEPKTLDSSAVVIDVDTAFDATVALLATGMVGLADRVGEAGGPNRLVISRTGRSLADGGTAFALNRWAVVSPTETLALDASSTTALKGALTHVLGAMRAEQRAEIVAALHALVDEYAIPDGDGTTAVSVKDHLPELVRGIWQQVLDGSAHYRDEDDFFDLGGDSIDAIRMIAILNHELQTDLEVALIFDNPTVSQLSDAVRSLI